MEGMKGSQFCPQIANILILEVESPESQTINENAVEDCSYNVGAQDINDHKSFQRRFMNPIELRNYIRFIAPS